MTQEIAVDLCPKRHMDVAKSGQGQRPVSKAALKAGLEAGVGALGGGKDVIGGTRGGAGLAGR